MSIFRRQPTPPEPAAPSSEQERLGSSRRSTAKVTHVAGGSKIEGVITGSTELLIEGEVEGQLRLGDRVTVGPGGLVRGEIEARFVSIGGRVQGNVRARERVEVMRSGALEGDVAAPRVVIAEGAFFKGRVEMKDAAGRKAGSPTAGPKEAASKPDEAPTTRQGGGRGEQDDLPAGEKDDK